VKPSKYNRTVLDAERSAERFTRGGRQGIVLRFAAFYGPDSPQTQEMIKFARKGWAPLPGSPTSFFSSLSHDDAATAVLAALNAEAGTYNVVDDEPLRHHEYFESLAKYLACHLRSYRQVGSRTFSDRLERCWPDLCVYPIENSAT
jgi:2-alkyl-3-oxoalkanoate reductase